MLLRHSSKRLVGTLKDSLCPDERPGPGGHLSVHDEPLLLQLVEVVPSRPFRNNHTVDYQSPRRHSVGLENSDRLATLDEKSLILPSMLKSFQNSLKRVPRPS